MLLREKIFMDEKHLVLGSPILIQRAQKTKYQSREALGKLIEEIGSHIDP